MDHRRFLGRKQELVAPSFGTGRVDGPDRRLRVEGEASVGWWRFELRGRVATPKERVDPPDLSKLPRVRGFLLGERLVRERGAAERVHLMPDDEPARFAPASARRWHGGSLVFDGLEFETGVEDEVRRALEDGRTLADVKGVPAPLRAAFALAVAEGASRTTGLCAQPIELRRFLSAIADGGVPEAERALRTIEAERVLQRSRAPWTPELPEVRVPRIVHRERPIDERIEDALESAGARLRRTRSLQSGAMIEVVYDFEGESFVTLVDAGTLQVVDAGVCLAGADRMVTLESLPSVLREAMNTDHLVITRHEY